MAQQLITAINISQDEFNFIKSSGTAITIVINYYNDDTPGYEILLAGIGGTKSICARPCPTYYPPTNNTTVL